MARGQWWEYLIPGHNVGLMVGDVYDSITGNSEKNAGTGVFGTRKNDSNSYQYAQSNDRVTTAKNNLDYIKGQKPGEYQSEYGSQISGTQSQLNSAQTEYANAVGANQKKDANNTNFWGNVLQVGASMLPWVLKALAAI